MYPEEKCRDNATRQEQRKYVTAQSKGETVIRRLSTFLLTIAAFVSVMSAVGLAQSQTLMTRHTREEVTGKVAPLVGHLSATQNLRLVLVLPHRNQPELDQFLKDVWRVFRIERGRGSDIQDFFLRL